MFSKSLGFFGILCLTSQAGYGSDSREIVPVESNTPPSSALARITSQEEFMEGTLTARDKALVNAVSQVFQAQMTTMMDAFERRSRLQEARLEELMARLRLVEGQIAPGPKFNFGLGDSSDSEGEASLDSDWASKGK